MIIKDKIILVTGANRGVGKALVDACLKHGAKKVYAASRNIENLPDFKDQRVVPLVLDITNETQIKQAVETAKDVDFLINNAGILMSGSFLTSDVEKIYKEMDVNYFGTLNMMRAFVPVLSNKGGGGIVNIASIVAFANIPTFGGYSASKAALFSATQAFRGELKSLNIDVYGVFPGPIDTDMTKSANIKDVSSLSETAENIIKSVESGEEYIFPDPVSAEMGKLWLHDPVGLEKNFSQGM